MACDDCHLTILLTPRDVPPRFSLRLAIVLYDRVAIRLVPAMKFASLLHSVSYSTLCTIASTAALCLIHTSVGTFCVVFMPTNLVFSH